MLPNAGPPRLRPLRNRRRCLPTLINHSTSPPPYSTLMHVRPTSPLLRLNPITFSCIPHAITREIREGESDQAAPHIGHLHTLVLTDTFARFARLRNPRREVLFNTGTDEHGMKIQQAAKAAGVGEREFCDGVSERFRVGHNTTP